MKKSSVLILILVGCILAFPIIFYGIPFQSDEGVPHARLYIHFSEQFWNGELYPRWLVGMNNGLGSPVLFFVGFVYQGYFYSKWKKALRQL